MVGGAARARSGARARREPPVCGHPFPSPRAIARHSAPPQPSVLTDARRRGAVLGLAQSACLRRHGARLRARITHAGGVCARARMRVTERASPPTAEPPRPLPEPRASQCRDTGNQHIPHRHHHTHARHTRARHTRAHARTHYADRRARAPKSLPRRGDENAAARANSISGSRHSHTGGAQRQSAHGIKAEPSILSAAPGADGATGQITLLPIDASSAPAGTDLARGELRAAAMHAREMSALPRLCRVTSRCLSTMSCRAVVPTLAQHPRPRALCPRRSGIEQPQAIHLRCRARSGGGAERSVGAIEATRGRRRGRLQRDRLCVRRDVYGQDALHDGYTGGSGAPLCAPHPLFRTVAPQPISPFPPAASPLIAPFYRAHTPLASPPCRA